MALFFADRRSEALHFRVLRGSREAQELLERWRLRPEARVRGAVGGVAEVELEDLPAPETRVKISAESACVF